MRGRTPWTERDGLLVLPDGRSADRVDRAWSAPVPGPVRPCRQATPTTPPFPAYRRRGPGAAGHAAGGDQM